MDAAARAEENHKNNSAWSKIWAEFIFTFMDVRREGKRRYGCGLLQKTCSPLYTEGIFIWEEEIDTIYINGNSRSLINMLKDSYQIYRKILNFPAAVLLGNTLVLNFLSEGLG